MIISAGGGQVDGGLTSASRRPLDACIAYRARLADPVSVREEQSAEGVRDQTGPDP
jgi:hypothetical protein